ncbi:hypothetical protein PI124_g23514 [Phytophthora idaei]|nr:hypothetical protein PI125_g10611 [Phytophthora idaei]KAG3231391.1 hypothetical protein PI124_g23514 [Phytophthora idaei]
MDPNLRAPEWAVSFERDKNGELRRIQRLVRDIQQGQRNILKEVRRSRQAIERMGHQLARIDARLIRMEARQIRILKGNKGPTRLGTTFELLRTALALSLMRQLAVDLITSVASLSRDLVLVMAFQVLQLHFIAPSRSNDLSIVLNEDFEIDQADSAAERRHKLQLYLID